MSVVGVGVGDDSVYFETILGCLDLIVVPVLLLVGDLLHSDLKIPWFLLCFGRGAHYTAV